MKTRFESMPDRWIENAFRDAADDSLAPGELTDRRILARARVACQPADQPRRFWIWPASLAASLALCAFLGAQLLALVEEPTVVVLEPAMSRSQPDRPPPRYGVAEPAGTARFSGTITGSSEPLIEREQLAADIVASDEPLSPEAFALAMGFLSQAASEDDAQSFAALLERVQAHPEVRSGRQRLPPRVLEYAASAAPSGAGKAAED